MVLKLKIFPGSVLKMFLKEYTVYGRGYFIQFTLEDLLIIGQDVCDRIFFREYFGRNPRFLVSRLLNYFIKIQDFWSKYIFFNRLFLTLVLVLE